MKRAVYTLAFLLAAGVFALIIIDPARDRLVVNALLALAVVLVLAARWVPSR